MKNILKKWFNKKEIHYHLEILRFVLASIFLWSFFDKLFGLGYSTQIGKAWVDGVSPTSGFLSFATEGKYFAPLFQSMSGSPLVDWLFMLGLLGIGTSLLLGIGTKVAGYSGALLMTLLWFASLPPEHHPFIDEHVVYFVIFVTFIHKKIGYWYGLRGTWQQTELVKKYPVLE